MKKILFYCLLLPVWQLSAQPTQTHSFHFRPDGFIQNKGQICDEHGNVNNSVTFLYAQGDFHLALTPSGFSYELIHSTPDVQGFPESGFTDDDNEQAWRDAQSTQVSVNRVDVRLEGASPHPTITTDENTGTVFNYYIGNNPVSNVPSFNRITYHDIYPGIDLVFENHHSENGSYPEYSFIVRPGGNVNQIKMNYTGAGNVRLEDSHTMSISIVNGFVKECGLRGYQLETGSAADVSFQLKKGTLSFMAEGNKSKTLVIDPVILWGSYFGGSGSENWDTESEIALNNENNVILTGSTQSTTNITTNGAVMQKFGGARDMLLAKFSDDGSQVEWATYFGGSKLDVAYGVCCDSRDYIYMTGFTESPDVNKFTADTLHGKSDVLIAKFSESGSLVWCHLMGGADDTDPENGRSLICDANNNVYICGYATSSSGVATPNAYQTVYGGGGDAFLAKYSQAGKKVWCTYFSGKGQDRAHALCFDPFGHIYFEGTCKSKSGIVPKNSQTAQTTFGGNTDAFIAKFDTTGKYYWSSYYGGTEGEHGRGVKCDAQGYVYFTGWTNSANNIASDNCFQNTVRGTDGFVAKFTPDGSRVWGTYFGGSSVDIFYGMTIDDDANLYLCGATSSTSNIAFGDAYQSVIASSQDAMFAKFDSYGNRIWASYFGGSADDASYDIERDNSGNLYFNVDTWGSLPVTNGTAWQGKDDLSVFEFNINADSTPQAQEPAKEIDIAEKSFSSVLEVAPNPATDYIKISNLAIEPGIAEVALFDMSGHLVLNREVNISTEGGTISLTLNQLPNGLYLIRCKQNENIRTGRVMINH